MIYADTNFFTSLLVEMAHSREAEDLFKDVRGALPVTWMLRLEVVNALQQCVFLTRQGLQNFHLTPELAMMIEVYFRDEAEAGVRFQTCLVNVDLVETIFHDLAYRHTARHGFRTYDILHVASALVLGCETFWSFDAKAKKLARLEGLAVN